MWVWPVCIVAIAAAAGCGTSDKPREATAAQAAGARAAQGSADPSPRTPSAPSSAAPSSTPAQLPADAYAEARFALVDGLVREGITDERLVAAMKIVPRHELVPPAIRHQAYDDRALPIGFDLTISQPFIVAAMTQAARVVPGDRVLEIGTGSGYQAAILAMMGAKVWTIEIHDELARRTKLVLDKLGFRDVQLRVGDGFFGWKDAAPFDAILITCATPAIPAPLLAQLKVGGRVVAPIEDDEGSAQDLVVFTKTATGMTRESLMAVNFGPMRGAVEESR